MIKIIAYPACRLILTLLMFGITSCASMRMAYQNEVCNENGGYQRGMNDARAGNAMDQSFADGCEGESLEVARTGYRKGFNAGLASLKAEQPDTVINVNIDPEGSSSQKRVYCEVKAFTDVFSAWGATELEAKISSQKKCEARHDPMHCDVVTCRQAK